MIAYIHIGSVLQMSIVNNWYKFALWTGNNNTHKTSGMNNNNVNNFDCIVNKYIIINQKMWWLSAVANETMSLLDIGNKNKCSYLQINPNSFVAYIKCANIY